MMTTRQSMIFVWRRGWAMLFVLAMLPLRPAVAGTGGIGVLPSPRSKAPSGLRLIVDTRWVDGNGYRPVRVRLSLLNGRPTPADRTVRVELRPTSWYWGNATSGVSAQVELAQGQTFGEAVIPVPQLCPWSAMDVKAWEDGKLVRELSAPVSVATGRNGQWSEASPTILFVDADAPEFDPKGVPRIAQNAPTTGPPVQDLPDVRSLANHFHLPEYYSATVTSQDFDTTRPIDDVATLKLLASLTKMEILPPTALFDRWIHYTNVDLMIRSFADLQTTVAMPSTWEAIRRWLAAGGTLVVYDVGDGFARLGDLEQLVGLTPLTEYEEEQYRAWRIPQAEDYGDQVRATQMLNWGRGAMNTVGSVPVPLGVSRRAGQVTVGSVNGDDQTAVTPQPPNVSPFVWRPAERGHLVALAAENPFPGQPEDWAWLFNSLDDHDWMWYRRHGMARSRENPDFWNWMIPGVGGAPVNSFLVLISLFVLVIGPVNYILLQRYGQLHLLLLFVPVGAASVTMALFLYALLDDGLGARGRARSLTLLDQGSGRVVTWGRHAYYAGLVPSGGLSYSTDTAVYPFEHYVSSRDRSAGSRRRILWGQDQTLVSGYLKSRTLAQMMVVQSRKTEARLEVQAGQGADGVPRLTNHLGVDIGLLVVSDADRRLHVVNSLAQGESADARAPDTELNSQTWRTLFRENRLAFPVGFDADQMENASSFFRSRVYYPGYDIDAGLPKAKAADSILERGLEALGYLSLKDLPPRSYVAIVAAAPDLPMGIASIQEEASFHVIEGRW